MIEVSLHSAEINGDRGTISLSQRDAVEGLDRSVGKIDGLTPNEIDDMVRCCDEHASCMDCPWDEKGIACDQNVVVHYANLLLANLRGAVRG